MSRRTFDFYATMVNGLLLRGTYAACLQNEALDMSVIGRDILNLFAVIVDARIIVCAPAREPQVRDSA